MTEDHRLIKSAKSARGGNVSEAIPEDVIKAATDFQDMVDRDPKAYTAFDVAVLAILAEREACAKIAEGCRDDIWNSEWNQCAEHVASATRRR